MLSVGMIVDDRYKILRLLGRGGTSCVYLAENIRLHSFWAIKEVYKSCLEGTGPKGSVFAAEAHILTRLRHPGLPSIIDIIDRPDAYLIVMEYVDGVSLDKVLAQRGAQNVNDVIRWGQQLCDVLTYLHSQRPAIIFRDMKPANIMLKKNGDVVLIDFGMAREFKFNSLHDTSNLGTHGYAAPEQYEGTRQSDARTDIYSLGVTLYHLVTGRDPCRPPYGIKAITSINPNLPRGLEQVIRKATQLEMEDRFSSASQMRNALSRALSGGNVVEWNVTDELRNGEPEELEEPEETQGKGGTAILVAGVVVAVLVLMFGLICGVLTLQGGTSNASGGGFLRELQYAVSELFGNEDDSPGLYYEQMVYVSYPDERLFYQFTPEKTGTYYIYSTSQEAAPLAWLLDENDNIIAQDNVAGEYSDFTMVASLRAGETYYIETTLYDLDPDLPATGYYYIYVEYDG